MSTQKFLNDLIWFPQRDGSLFSILQPLLCSVLICRSENFSRTPQFSTVSRKPQKFWKLNWFCISGSISNADAVFSFKTVVAVKSLELLWFLLHNFPNQTLHYLFQLWELHFQSVSLSDDMILPGLDFSFAVYFKRSTASENVDQINEMPLNAEDR